MVGKLQLNNYNLVFVVVVDSILFFIKHFLSVLNKSITLVFFLRTSGEYSKRYGQGFVFSTDP